MALACPSAEPGCLLEVLTPAKSTSQETKMGKGILLWLLGIPIPIIILLLLFWH
jgi:hypothetical protein